MGTKHTPGPWKAAHIGEGEYRREIVIEVATCGQIAEVLDVGNGRTDARLIAAAPDMAALLGEILPTMRNTDTFARIAVLLAKIDGEARP